MGAVLLATLCAAADPPESDPLSKVAALLPPEGLDPVERVKLVEVLKQVSGYGDCTKFLWTCLSADRPSPHVQRLVAFVARILKHGGQPKDVKDFMILRDYSLHSGPQYRIALDGYPPIGKGDKVTIVVYADFECPFCAKLSPVLRRLAETPGLGVRVYFKPWPIRGHPHSVETAMALIAAGEQGKFWEMHQKLFENQRDLSPERVRHMAADVGCDLNRFKKALKSPKIRKKVEAAKREGIVNEVEATPTIFLNGRTYYLEPSYEGLKDAVEEVADFRR